MKKFLVVLTILVLVAGFAFATVTGSVEAKYKFDFSDGAPKTLTYGVWGSNAKVSFTLTTDKGGVDGSNKPYATVSVDLKLAAGQIAKQSAYQLEWDDDDYVYSYYKGISTNLAVTLVLSDFRIVGENWEIDFLKAIGVGDYAKSAWELDGDDDAIDAPWTFGTKEGVTVTYDDYKVGVRATRNELLLTNVDLRTESKEFTFAEGVTGQAAVAFGLAKQGDEDATFAFGASVKAAYATDDVTVNGAVDVQYVLEKFDADVAVKVAVKPVTVDAYYATRLQAERAHSLLTGDAENVLSVKAVVALDPVTVTVYGEDLINADRLLAIKEEGKFGALTEDAQFGIYPSLHKDDILGIFLKNIWFANAGIGYDVQENLNVNAHAGYMRGNLAEDAGHLSALVFQLGAEYKLEKFTFAADAYLGKSFTKIGNVDSSDDLRFGCEVKASSDKLVENAVLTATLHIDKYGVIGLYDATLVDSYAGQQPALDDAGMYFQVGCKVAF
jgi:hypothetical protein